MPQEELQNHQDFDIVLGSVLFLCHRQELLPHSLAPCILQQLLNDGINYSFLLCLRPCCMLQARM